MSDEIDIPITVTGGAGIDQITISIDRLSESMLSLGSTSPSLDRLNEAMAAMQGGMTSSLAALTQSISDMKQVMATGFADISATNQKLIEAMGTRQARALEAAGDKAAAAVTEGNAKITAAMRADASTLLQASRGMSSNVEQAFALMFVGASPDAVRERFGQIAAETAAGLKSVEDLMQFRANARSVKTTGYDPMRGATEAEMQQAQAMNAARDSAAAAEHQALVEKRDLEEYRTRSAASAELQALIEKRDTDEYRIRSAASAELQALIEKRDVEEYRMRSAAAAELQALVEKRDMEEYRTRSAASAELKALIEKRDLEEYQIRSEASARLQALQESRDTEEYRMREAQSARLRSLAERDAVQNAGYRTASPTSQLQTQIRAVGLRAEGLDPSQFVGPAAAADAAGKSVAGLRAELEALRTTSAAAGAAQFELGGALRQAEGAFRGAAHEAGIYGLHHGQLIALLAGGAVAAALHHIAETGAEVEFQLASLNALQGSMTPVDINKFIGVTSGSMTSLKDAAEGMHALAQAGQTEQAAFAALPDVMRLASLGEMSVAQAAEMAVESMHAFGKEITDLGQIGDILVAVGSKSNVSVHTLAEDMKSAAVTGAMFNLNMEEITATVGALAERGLTIQPLSSALMKLYEPSDKTAKAMRELGLTTKTSAGDLKKYSDFMAELTDKVNQFKVPADVFKQLGMSSRDSKAIEVMTQHFGDYEHLLHEAKDAHGKMFDAMTAKEDTVEGSWKRLGSTVEGSLTKAFMDASPVIREVEENLMRVAGSEGTVNALSNLASGVARLTGSFVENAGTLATLLAAYTGFRMLSSLTTMAAEFAAAQRLQAVATTSVGATAGVSAVQLELFAVAENTAAAGATRLGTGLEVAAAGARLATSALGWIGVAIVGATALFDLLSGSMDKNDAEHLKQQNTYNTTTDAIQREIDRLKELEDQLLKTGKTGTAAAAAVALSFAQVEETKARGNLEAAQESTPVDTSLRMAGRHGPMSRNGDQMKSDAVTAAEKALADAHARVVATQNQLAELETREDNVAAIRNVTDLRKKVEDLPSSIQPAAKTAAAQAAAKAANEHLAALKGQEITELNRVQIEKDLKQVQGEILATKRDVVKADAGDKDGARARIEQMQEELRLAQMQSKSRLDDAKSENRRGELGDLALINKTLAENVALHERAVDIARKELAAAGPLKPGQQEKYNSRIQSAEQQLVDDRATAARATADMWDRMDTAELQHRAKTLEDKGQLEDAFNLQWEAKYGRTLANLDDDIEKADSVTTALRLMRYEAFLNDLREEGSRAAVFKIDTKAFDADVEHMQVKLSDLRERVGAGTGLGARVSNTLAQKTVIEASLPKQRADYAKAKEDAGTDPTKLKQADSMLKKIQSEVAELDNIFVALGDTIAKALTDAFGRGGAALGGLITTATNYDAEMKNIQATLAASGKTEEDKKTAADATASAQIKAYGDMAGAAKGFFDAGSNGYKILSTAEKAYRAIELAQAISVTAKKISLKGAEVTTTVAGDAAKVTSGTTSSLASMANAAMEAAAWGVTAVARAIASMPFPLNLAAGAATMAAIVGLGIKLTGGLGGGDSAAQRQADNGTGTIAGDPKAKSDSIAKSLALVEKNTFNNLNVSQDMLSSLRAIQANITNFAGLLLQNANISNPEINLKAGYGSSALGKVDMVATGAEIGAMFGAPFIGAIVGAVATKIPAIGKLFTSIVGGKQSLDDSGFMLGASTLGQIANQGVSAKTYADVTTSGGWFRSDKHNTNTSDLGTDVDRQIAQIITGLGDTVRTAAGILGVSGSEFDAKLNGFVVDIGKISLKGLSAADQQKAIETAFSKLGDQMASSALSTITQFSKAGEGALETLTRVAADYQAVDAVFKSYGTAFSAVGTESIAAREKLIDLAGGLDKFTSQADFFFKNFLTQGQQTAATRASIQPTLDKYGLSADGSDAVTTFAKMAISFGAMGAAGAEAYTELMNIAPAFKAITDVAKDLQTQIDDLLMTQVEKDAAQRATLDPANQALFDQLQQAKAVSAAKSALVSAYDSESQAIQSTIDKLKSFSLSLRSFVNSLQLGNLSPLNPADQYGAAQALFNDTLAKAKAGDATAQSNLQSAAQAFLQASRTANASNSTYQSDYQKVVSATTAMADWADTQVSEGQKNLNALHDQVAALVTLNGTSLSVIDALNNLRVAMAGGKDMSTNTSALATVYQELLGRAPDQAGLAFWNTQMQNGVSLSAIIDAIKHSSEYADYQNKLSPTNSVTPSTQYGAGATSSAAALTSQVTALYQQYMKHAPDQAGLDYWVKQLQGGVSIDAVSAAIKNSQEATTTVTKPAAATVTAPVASVVAAPAATASSSLAGQVSSLYQQYLGRSADQAGLDYWVKQLQSGTSMAAVTAAIRGSAEAAAPAPVTQPAPATATTSKSSASVDPYAAAIAQNAQMAAQLATLNAQVAALRTEQQTQSDQQLGATMAAGANTGSDVADAIQTSAQAAAWASQNKAALR